MPTKHAAFRLDDVTRAQLEALVREGYAEDRTAVVVKAVSEVYKQHTPRAKRKKPAKKS